MSFYDAIVSHIPEVKGPTQKRLSFKQKTKWTLIVLMIFFILGTIPLLGLDPASQFRFEQLALILGAVFGSIISLGIGPIVTASIVMQLLNGSGLVKFDLTTQEGKKRFQGANKLLSVVFVVFESFIYVYLGGFSPVMPTHAMHLFLVGQLILGGILILFLDEIVQKWGFGSGISLFIVAGVAQQIFVQAFSPLDAGGKFVLGTGIPVGKIFSFFILLMQNQPSAAILEMAAIIATIVVFVVAVYTQAMKVEIPLSFGRIRGYGMRWPLRFIYTSNIPVILVAALLANIQLFAQLLQNKGIYLLGTLENGVPSSGLIVWLSPVDIVRNAIQGSVTPLMVGNAITYTLLMVSGAVVFSIFWVQTSGMDARSQAKQIMASGLQIPGFRKDIRILERILQRYIGPLTVMGAIAVGVLAALADLTSALSRGTGILLAVMIIYQLYEEIARQHAMDMSPMMRRFME